jgi:hypothetical protein
LTISSAIILSVELRVTEPAGILDLADII